VQPFLSVIQENAPKPLSESVRELESYGPDRWSALLSQYWHGSVLPNDSPAERFTVRAFLQPVAQYLAERADFDCGTDYALPLCPFCRRKPALGVLRPEGDGAKRSLVCSLCSSEWQYRRIVCPGCGETEVDKLPVFTAAAYDYVRVECCNSCMQFIKTVDLTKQGRATPVVDELAILPLTLWANEKGYTKLEPNLLGM
jgi:FdhE protein